MLQNATSAVFHFTFISAKSGDFRVAVLPLYFYLWGTVAVFALFKQLCLSSFCVPRVCVSSRLGDKSAAQAAHPPLPERLEARHQATRNLRLHLRTTELIKSFVFKKFGFI
jgi:hypothetical protein